MTPRPPPPRPSVLIVDDEAVVLDVLELSLKEHFDVERARSANEAELMLATGNYDVIVCDHLMPDEEGLSFLTRARSAFPKVQRKHRPRRPHLPTRSMKRSWRIRWGWRCLSCSID